MSEAFNSIHPLSDESGMSQRRRLMSALDATQNRLDARDLADILVYIHPFSKQVNFYDFSLEVSNWSVFFEKSAPFILARLARQNTEGVISEFQQYNALVKNDPTPANFQLLLDFTYRTTLLDVAALYADTKSVRGFQTVLEQELSSHEMTDAIRQFLGIANAAQYWLCGTKKDFSFLTEDPVWQLDITDIFAQNSLVSSERGSSVIGTKASQKQSILAWQRALEQYFAHFSLVLTRLSQAAETHLNESLYPLETAFKERHEPHLGLLFAFLELFKHLKGQLNELTAKHLDFYFRQVLKIQSRKAIPDAVHLVVETQKHIQKQLLKRGIEFRDGKDAKGQDILFSLDDEIIVNKAQITALKTLFVKKNRSYTEGVFIAPVANSVDGKGMDFKEPMSKNWATLGSYKSKLVPKLGNESLEPNDNPLARLGFILASPVLFLQEGTRTARIELMLANAPENFALLSNFDHPFKIYFSGEKEWIIVKNYVLTVTNELLKFTITLDPTVAPIVHFNAENLKENYNTTQPLVKIEIDQTAKMWLNTEGSSSPDCCAERLVSTAAVEVSAYHFLKNVQLTGAKITVNVSGIKKNIIVQNDENVQDVNGLMYPFGTRPEVPDFSVVNEYKPGTRDGSNFYIGSKEIFLKKWQEVNIYLNWKDKPSYFKEYYGAYLKRPADSNDFDTRIFKDFGLRNEDFKVNAAYLSEGGWQKEGMNQPLFTDTRTADFEQTMTFSPDAVKPTNKHDLTAPLTKLEANTRNGFVRLTLKDQDFLHKDYPFVLARQMMAFGRFPDEVTGAIYMIDNVPQVVGRFELFEKINALLKSFALTIDVPNEVRAFMKQIRDIINGEPSTDTNTAEIKFNKIDNKLTGKTGETIVENVNHFIVELSKIVLRVIVVDATHTKIQLNAARFDEIETLFTAETPKKTIQKVTDFLNDIIGIIRDTETKQAASDKKFKDIKTLFDVDKVKENEENTDKSIAERVQELADFAKAQKGFLEQLGAGGGAKKALIPNEPWTPIIKNISLDYVAEAETEDIALIHLYPFEVTFKAEDLSEMTTLLPQFEDEGTLFIGLEQLEPNENLQILFQLAEATADTEGGRATVKWAYLSKNNDWKPLRTGFEILVDATNGLTASGILKLAIPEDIGVNIGIQNIDNQLITQMPSGQSWLKASAVDNTRAVCETLGIFTQAVRATARITEGSDTVRLDTPLPAESVGKLAVADAAIKQVMQPFDSFGGRMEETGNTFYLRVSERLRHKGRATTPFDYERLLLEAFPDIYKVKCIPHSLALPANQFQVDLQQAAGFVTLAVIPDLTRLKSGNLTEPRVALHLLDQITAFLKERSSPFARLKVVNPRYEKVKIGFKLKLKKGKDIPYYRQQLIAELRLFLAPWSVGDSDKLSFGQPIYYSDILTFIDQREYVDYVKCLEVKLEEDDLRCPTPNVETDPSVFLLNDKEKAILATETGILRPLTPRSVLIAGQINIDILPNTCD